MASKPSSSWSCATNTARHISGASETGSGRYGTEWNSGPTGTAGEQLNARYFAGTSLAGICVGLATSIRDVIQTIDRNGHGIALVVDDEQRLLGTITDGDVRRAILSGTSLDTEVAGLVNARNHRTNGTPIIASPAASESELLRIMTERSVRHIPILDEKGRVIDLAFLDQLVQARELPIRAVVMAGGFGTRMRPLTDDLPKPMLPLGGRPLLELTVEQLRKAGIHEVSLTTHYKQEVIAEHFGDGRDFGVHIHYIQEDLPLGTAGSLSLLDPSEQPSLVLNGDILTRVDFRSMLDFHREHQADMTVGVRDYKFRVPYGVVELDGVHIRALVEKPLVEYFINAGIYLLEPGVQNYIVKGESCDMPELVRRLVTDRRTVVSFPIREYWMDIGQLEDYKQAVSDLENNRL